MIELTDDDRRLLLQVARSRQPGEGAEKVMERIAASFIAAGLERAAKVCFEPEPECCGEYIRDSFDHPPECCGNFEPRHKTHEECAAAIRALLPADIRGAIWRAYVPGQERTMTPSDEYLKAAHAAQAWIAAQGKP